MNNNPDAMFCFRNGDNNVAYGNFFIKSGGIRCKQSNNVWIYNNYFEMAGTGWDSSLPGSGTRAIYFLTYAGYNNNYNVLHNTFYKCGESEIQTGMTNCTWANNAFYSTSGNIFTNSGTTAGQTFVGNIYQGTLGLTIPNGMTNTDPKLALNSDGYYSIGSTSPAINASSVVYPKMYFIPGIDTLLLDIQGQARPVLRAQRDVGCEEYNATGTVINKPLKLTDVGPSYLNSISTTVDILENNLDFSVYLVPADKKLVLNYTLIKNSSVGITLFNLNGVILKEFTNMNVSEGSHTEKYDISTIQPGIYFVRLTINGFSKTKKIITKN